MQVSSEDHLRALKNKEEMLNLKHKSQLDDFKKEIEELKRQRDQ